MKELSEKFLDALLKHEKACCEFYQIEKRFRNFEISELEYRKTVTEFKAAQKEFAQAKQIEGIKL